MQFFRICLWIRLRSKKPPGFFESVTVYVAGESSSSGREGAACCGAQRHWVALKKSGVLHCDAGRRRLTRRPVGKGFIVGYDYGFVV